MTGRLRLTLWLFRISTRFVDRAVRVLKGAIDGLWLGIAGPALLRAIDEQYYNAEPQYTSDAYNESGFFDWERKLVSEHFGSCASIAVTGAGVSWMQLVCNRLDKAYLERRREILFLTDQIGWAVGGNIYSAEGGIYFSDDGGQTWSPDFDSEGHELDACANVGQKVWCAGYDASFNGAVYALDLDPPAVDVSPGVLNFSVASGATDSAPVTLTNTGGGSLTFAIDEAAQADCAVPGDVPWLGETPTEGSIAAGSSQDVSVEVDATGLADGYYAALLCIATNDPDLPLALLTVSLTVGGGDTIFKDGFEGVP